ncbi:MAG: Ig-like domain-containing protein [Thermoplasmatota archaeon]
MNRILILGILAILTTAAFTSFVLGEDKIIDTNEFSFGDEVNYTNMTMKEVNIGEDLFNNEAKIFVYNNATYDYLAFDLTGGKDQVTGEYLSEVSVDLGNNNQIEYRFGGTGSGQWGNQTYFETADKAPIKKGDAYPSVEGDLYYIKLPSDAVVTSTTVNITHIDEAVSRDVRLPSSNNWARSYWYHYGYYNYGYGYYYPSSNAGYYALQYSYYPLASDYSRASGYPIQNGYLKWDTESDALKVPQGAQLQSYDLIWPLRLYRYSGSWPGESGRYHHGERTYRIFALEEAMPSSYQRSNTIYGGLTQEYAEFDRINPDWDPSSYAEFVVDEYHGDSSSYYYRNDVVYDLRSLLEDWNGNTLTNYGIMISMDETPIDTSPHDNGYSYYSGRTNYYRYYYDAYAYSPGASSSYNAYKPRISYSYTLDSTNPWIDVADDTTKDWSYTGNYVGTTHVTGFQGPINQYLRTHFPDEYDDYGNGWTHVPVRLGADAAGKITVSDFKLEYNYTAKVFYTPSSGSAVEELQSLVPNDEDGWSLIEINVTSNTQGTMKFDNLELRGTKPNYRPKVMEIPDMEINEGETVTDLLKVTDHFYDVDQDAQTLQYIIQMNDQKDYVDLYLQEDEGGDTWLGIDTSKDENWNGEVTCQISATDEFGKDAWSNEFMIDVKPVNDLPYLAMGMEDIVTLEGVDPILMEYNAPSGRGIANGKEVVTIGGGGEPHFADIENEVIHIDFELLGPDMVPVNLDWSNEDRHKIYRGADNKIYLTVLPPEYTDDPDNYIVLLGSDPDFYTEEGPYYLKVYASDDPSDLWNQTSVLLKIEIQAVNDPPSMLLIPDIVMDEDSSYLGTVDFVEEYIRDIDNELEELTVSFKPSSDSVMASLNEEGRLMIDLEMDFNGVVPITVEVSDGTNLMTGTFSVRIRSINDPPIIIVKNLFDGQTISDLYRIKGSADDIEKALRTVEVAVVKIGETIYTDDWIRADGAYVWQHLLDTRELDTGDYQVMVRAFDGRDFSEVLTYNVRIISMVDFNVTPPPKITITTPMLGDQAGTITVEGTVVDESGVVSFVEYRIDGGIWRKASILSSTEWQVIIDTKTLTNEEHNFSVRGYDEKTYSDIVFRRFQVYNEDSDGDGIPNDIEVSLLMDPFNKLDGTMDFDSDSFSNQEELMVYNTDPFDGDSVPDVGDPEPLFDTWALIFIAAAILCAAMIIGLFILNIRLERNIHYWREDLNRKRTERKPKTLLQKIVEIAPTYITGTVPEGPALPGQPVTDQSAALPPMPEGQAEQPPDQTV